MQLEKSKVEGEHNMYLNGRREAFRIARAMGLWRLSAGKLLCCAIQGGEVGLGLTQVNLESIQRGLRKPIPELDAFLGSLAVSTPEPVQEPAPVNLIAA